MTSDYYVLSSIAKLIKLLSSMSLFVQYTATDELLECPLPQKIRAGSLVMPSDSETANNSSLLEFSTVNLSNLLVAM